MNKDFNKWNIQKKDIDARAAEVIRYPKVNETWVCLLGENIGYEQNGVGENFARPVLVIKKFNNQMMWAIPLSTKQKDLDFYYNFTDPNGKPVSAILAQLRLISVKRFERFLYETQLEFVQEIKKRVCNFLT